MGRRIAVLTHSNTIQEYQHMSIYCPISKALGIEYIPSENATYNPDEKPFDPSYMGKGPLNAFYGKKHTEESKSAIRRALTGKPKSEQHKQALRKPKKKGHKQTVEHKYKKAMNKSSEWVISHPSGQREIVKNLSRFCRDNDLKYGQSNLIRGWSYKGYKAEKNGKITV